MTAPGSPIPHPAGPIGGKDTTWHRSSRCSGGGCIEVALCGGGSCVEVACEAGVVLVRDSKLGDSSPIQRWTVEQWERVLLIVKKDLDVKRPWEWVDSFANVRLTHNGVTLTFTSEEWDGFVSGVLAGDFEPQNLTPAAPLEASADEAADPRLAADATGAGGDPLSQPALVAPPNGAPIDSPAGRGQTVFRGAAEPQRAGQSGPTAAALVQLCMPLPDVDATTDAWALEWATRAYEAGVRAGFATARAGDGEPAWHSGPLVQHIPATLDDFERPRCSCAGCGSGSCDDCKQVCEDSPAIPPGEPAADSVTRVAAVGAGREVAPAAGGTGAGATENLLLDYCCAERARSGQDHGTGCVYGRAS